MANPYASPIDSRPLHAAPLVRQASTPGSIVTIAIVLVLAVGGWFITKSPVGVLWGIAIYFAYAWLTRTLIPREHRRGIRLVSQARYEEAIQAFESSLSFFSRNAWLDRFRAVTMLSPSKMSYREMALCNKAFCHAQIGQGSVAKAIYQSVAAEYPDNIMAPAALRMLEAGKQTAVHGDSGAENK